MKRITLTALTVATVATCSGEKRTDGPAPEHGAISEADDDDDDDDDDNGGEDDGTEKLDSGDPGTGDNSNGDGDNDGKTNQIDILFVIDNSGSTGQEQKNLAHNFPLLVQQLQNLTDSGGNPVDVDVQIMVTTTDMEHSACGGTSGAKSGEPVDTACTTRLNDFIFNGEDERDACTDNCPNPVVPTDPFLWFYGNQDNVPDVPDADVNEDGTPDSAAAQALACIGPQGTTGCWYEAPLDAMMAAVDPSAPHNQGDRPFVRKNAVLAVAVVTDEADCSINETEHPEVFDQFGDQEFWNTNPQGQKQMSSAICWNAGTDCQDAGNGTYDCEPTDEPLVDPATYKDHLKDLILEEDKEVVMLGIIGVPVVTAHSEDPPHLPEAGGVLDLVYRDWIDGTFPNGDLLPGEPRTVDELAFQFTIGPGCTEVYDGDRRGQAVPAPRIIDVCQSLDKVGGDDEERVRCCIESICDDDFSAAITCLTELIGDVTEPPE